MTRWLTRSEAAQHARMSLATFQRRIREGKMPAGHGKTGGKRVWDPAEIDAAIRGEQAGVADPIMEEIRRANAQAS
ncbi:MAG: hypothetical protein RIC14_00225 [Filomicrobium sp.]